MAINRVHPSHSDERWRRLHHYFLTFHDETFEALAAGIQGKFVRGTMESLLLDAARRLVHPRSHS